MKYCMFLWPHANVRYQNETIRLSQSELRLMLDRLVPGARVVAAEGFGAPALILETASELNVRETVAICGHSLMYQLMECREDGLMRPLCGRPTPYLGADLPGILKYRGKTNELFLQLMINVALYAGDFWDHADAPLELLDPMCGRATALFVGANLGWNVSGTDIDRGDLGEAERFFKRYLEYHRFKHGERRSSRTLQGQPPARLCEFSFADAPERFKAGDVRTLQLADADTANVRGVFGRDRFHLIVCDLPYGVQHASVGGSPEQLLRRALPAWRDTLKRGGAMALSFNAQTLKRRTVLDLMEAGGLEPLDGEQYAGFEHWVEQAVTRDIAVGRRK